MSEELKPCPFCGSAHVAIVAEDRGNLVARWWYGYCHDCHACGPEDLGRSGATESWNTRAPLDKSGEIVYDGVAR